MSMSCCVLSNRHLDTTDAWQRSLDELGLALRLDAGGCRAIADLSGHLPATWEAHEAGFECSAGGEDEVVDTTQASPGVDFGGPWSCVLDLDYWGYPGTVGSMMAAAAYAKATGGVVYEGEEGIILDAEAAVALARKTEQWVRDAIEADEG